MEQKIGVQIAKFRKEQEITQTALAKYLEALLLTGNDKEGAEKYKSLIEMVSEEKSKTPQEQR